MNFWGAFLILVGALYFIAYGLDRVTDADPVFRFFWGLITFLALASMLGQAGCNKATVAGELADVAQLRLAAASVNLEASEDVAGKVADFNQGLAKAKWTNNQWWGDPFVPDEWDTVAFIPIRRTKP